MSITAPPQARDLTPEEQEERARDCRLIEVGIIQDLANGRATAWALAEKCYQFNQEQGHLALGYETQNEWLAQPEIGMSRVQFFRLVRMHRELRVFRELPMETLEGLDHSKLGIVLPVIEANSRPIEQIIDDVRTLGAKDLREEYVGVVDRRTAPPASSNGDEPPQQTEEQKEREKIREAHKAIMEAVGNSAAQVDSWVTLGGDRRKAMRHWRRVLEDHPVFAALRRVQATVENDAEAPKRDEIQEDWKLILGTFKFKFPEASSE